jgi:GNAT superfamily N-acetyltransferase
MERSRVTLRPMTADEYRRYVDEVQAEVVRELSPTMSEEEARAHAARGVAQHLPEGVATTHHSLVIAEDAAGTPVGTAWVGPDPHRGEDSDGAWLYDINVYPHARRHGYGSAILAEVEALVARDGKARLGLNVFGGNEAAIALYRKNGYMVTTQQMSKVLS